MKKWLSCLSPHEGATREIGLPTYSYIGGYIIQYTEGDPANLALIYNTIKVALLHIGLLQRLYYAIERRDFNG